MATSKNKLTKQQQAELFKTLKTRFEKYMARHKGLKWDDVQKKLDSHPQKQWTLFKMEETGGEPDVIGFDKNSGEFLFCDCAAESPKGRRSICYDHEALEARKEHKPDDSAINMAEDIGIEILTEDQYQELQKLGSFDAKTSSWLKTPASVRKLGGGIYGDRRYDRVFIGHNGADSYYAARGFRGILKV